MLTALLLSNLALPLLASAAAVSDRASAGDGFLRLDVTKRQSLAKRATYGKRQDVVALANAQNGEEYLITLGIGTPPQNVQLTIDTGSSDLWVDPDCATAPDSTDVAFCETLGFYDYTKSSTFVDLKQQTFLSYGSGNATVEYGTETVAVGSATLKAQQFGVGISSDDVTFGVLGIGPRTFANQPIYVRFVDNLVAQGITKSRAFSLDLRSIDDPSGSIIFGGVDTGKYIGALQKLPIIPSTKAPDGTRYWVTLDTISITNPDGSSTSVLGSSLPVMLDSGSAFASLPMSVFNALGSSFPTASLDSTTNLYTVDCGVADQSGTVDYTFAGKTISVQYKDAILAFPENGVCVLGIQAIPADETPQSPILGDSFLRAAYAIYDQDNQNIHLAQAANCGSNILSIGVGPDAVPSKTGDCGGSSSTTTTPPPSSTASTIITAPPKSAPTTTSAPYSNSTTSAPGNGTITSTVYTTTVYTITSCAATVTNCPVGHVTTETLTSLTTYCPGGSSSPTSVAPPPPPPMSSSTPCPTETETGSPTPPATTGSSDGKHCPTCGPGATATSSGAAVVVTAGAERAAGAAGPVGLGLGVAVAAAVAFF